MRKAMSKRTVSFLLGGIALKKHLKIIESVIAVAGGTIFGVGSTFYTIHPLLPFLVTLVAVPLVDNVFVVDIVRECREQKGFAWGNKSVRKDLLCLLITLIFLWVVQFFLLRAKHGG